MGCTSCGGNKHERPTFSDLKRKGGPKATIISKGLVSNLVEAGKKQPDRFKWFRDGVSGIVKCLTGHSLYSDDDIIKNRDICRECEHSTKTDGKINIKSQCMAPDSEKDNAPCGCPIVCKTQTGKCPLNKWTHITVLGKKTKTESLNDEDTIVDI